MNMNAKDIITRDVWCLLGLPFDKVTLNSASEIIVSAIEQKQSYFLTTPNLNFVVQANSDDDFFTSVVDSDLSVADGMPLIWVAKILGIPITERVAGSTLFDALSKQTNHRDKIKVFFFGGQTGVAKVAAEKLNATSEGMQSCGYYDPGFVSVDEMSSSEIINTINAAEPDFLVVALGAKKGQQWIQKNRHQLNAPVISHLGAVINFVAGSVERAPVLWQGIGLEWLWRIKQEPALWRRYLSDGFAFSCMLITHVVPLAVYDRVLKRTSSFKSPYFSHVVEADHIVLKLGGSIHYKVIKSLKADFVALIENSQDDVVIDCERLDYVDSAFIATLLLFERCLKEGGRKLTLSNLPFKIRLLFRLNNVMHRFFITYGQT